MARPIAIAGLAAALLFVAASAAATETIAAPPCTLSTSDLQALALAPSQLTLAGYLAFDPAHQQSVCTTRGAIKQLDAQNGVITAATMDQIMRYSTKYLSPAENRRLVDASNNFITALIKAKGSTP